MTRERDCVYGALVRARIKAMGIEEVVTAPRSPWQNPFVERMIGSIRPECLDHLITFSARRRIRRADRLEACVHDRPFRFDRKSDMIGT